MGRNWRCKRPAPGATSESTTQPASRTVLASRPASAQDPTRIVALAMRAQNVSPRQADRAPPSSPSPRPNGDPRVGGADIGARKTLRPASTLD